MNDVTNIREHTRPNTLLDRVEKLELAGANSGAYKIDDRLASVKLVRECFQWIRKDPPRAYLRLMKASLNVPSTAKQDMVNRCALFGRLSGYAMMYAIQSEDIFTRVMDTYTKGAPVIEG